ncbi:MAG: hypothetical protein AAB649_05615, partial [Patescibacteria group bacterium]
MNLHTFYTKRAIGFLVLLCIGGVVALFCVYTTMGNKEAPSVASDYKNISYIIDGQTVNLVNGVAEVESAPGSASKTTTTYFGNEVKKDLDGDRREDIAFLVTQDKGGSGTFFYVVAALNAEHGYVGSQAVLLGDRIAPKTAESGPLKSIIVNYMDRAQGEPMSA